MSSFDKLLRNSKMVALPPSIKHSSAVDYFPSSPIVSTSRASKHVGDWGLKRNLPLALRTDNITLRAIDTQEHQTSFASGNKYTKVVKRWQETGFAIGTPKDLGRVMQASGKVPPPNTGVHGTVYLPSISRKAANMFIKHVKLRKDNFKTQEELAELRTSNRQLLQKEAKAFLNIADEEPYTVHATGGLGYEPKGALSIYNLASGPVEKSVKARVLHTTSTRGDKLVGVAGIVSKLKKDIVYGAPKQGRETVLEVKPESVRFDQKGVMEVRVTTQDRQRDGGDRAKSATAWQGFGGKGKNAGQWIDGLKPSIKMTDMKQIEDRQASAAPVSPSSPALSSILRLSDKNLKLKKS